MTFSLVRTRDGAGDSGSMSISLRLVGDKVEEGGNRPKVGFAMRVGSLNGRTYAAQDYWTTTYVTEILEETENYVRFRTGNSEYEWKRF